MKCHTLSMMIAASTLFAQVPAAGQVASPARVKIGVPTMPQPVPQSDPENVRSGKVTQYKRGNINSGITQQYYCTVETRVDQGQSAETSSFTVARAEDGTLRINGSGPLIGPDDLSIGHKYILRDRGNLLELERVGSIIEPTEQEKNAEKYASIMNPPSGSSTGYNITKSTGDFAARVIRSNRNSFGKKYVTTYDHQGSCAGGV